MNENDKAILTAAIERVLVLFAAVVITILGGIVGGMIPFAIGWLIVAVFLPKYPEVSMLGALPALIGCLVGFVIAAKFSWEHLVKKSEIEEPRGFPVIRNKQK